MFFFVPWVIQIQPRPLQPGQINITQQTYDAIILQQLREVWTRYGALDEIWFDGGLVLNEKKKISQFIEESFFDI